MIDDLRRTFLVLFAALALGLGVAACDDGGSGDADSGDATEATTDDTSGGDDASSDDSGG